MERYRAAHPLESLVCPPPAAAVWYGEQVSPVAPASSPSIILHEPNTLQTAATGAGGQQPVQVNPASDTDTHQPERRHTTREQILVKVGAPYAARHKHLERMLKRLHPPTTAEAQPADEIEVKDDGLPLPTHPTASGTFSFPELYERSRKYAAFVLYYSFYMQPDDIEDGLQAGTIKLWQGLQAEPAGLQDKTMAWMGMKVVYTALHATRGDWKYRQQTQAEGEAGSKNGWGTHSYKSRQMDKRTDIQQP